jgi:hypothetical protein
MTKSVSAVYLYGIFSFVVAVGQSIFPPPVQKPATGAINLNPNQSVPPEQLREWEQSGSLVALVGTHTGQITDLRNAVDRHQSMLDTVRGAWWAVTGAITVFVGMSGLVIGLIGRPLVDWLVNRLRDHVRPRITMS